VKVAMNQLHDILLCMSLMLQVMLKKKRNLKLNKSNIEQLKHNSGTYDHRLERTGHPVRSAIHKLQIGGLVVGSVTTSEYPLLYVFVSVLLLCRFCFDLFSGHI
jgi:hypothetical protein